MATEITLPKLSDTMDEGKILRWLKRVGDHVAPGDVLAEVETDKADMEVEAAEGGVLSEIRVQVGETAAVGAVLAVLGGDAKAAPKSQAAKIDGAAAAKPAKAEKPAKQETRPQAAAEAHEADADAETADEDDAAEADAGKTSPAEDDSAEETAGAKPAAAAPLKFKPSEGPQASGRKLRASPLAQRLARERGVDLAEVHGSGAEGKIVARDVDSPAPAARASKPQASKAPEPASLAPGRLELSKMRQSIAKRMTEAKNGIPHFYVVAEIGMDEASRLLEALKEQVDAKITVSHLVAKAAAMALVEHPRVNGQWLDGAVEIPAAVNIGLAVAVDDGLVVPVIHGCEALSVGELASEARRLVAAAREGRFAGDDLKGGTFSISNLGILDVDEFSAIIIPPQAAILAVGSIKERPVVRGGQIVVGKTMRVTLSCDHRQLNGVEGARFLETLKGILEAPLRMVV